MHGLQQSPISLSLQIYFLGAESGVTASNLILSHIILITSDSPLLWLPCFPSLPPSVIPFSFPPLVHCPLLPVSPSPCFRFSSFFSLISSNLPHRDWARAPASAHFERCCRPKNVRSKHMRAVFIINQLYGPLMEVISAKFMLRDLAVFSKTAAR